jgi:HAE1 family hydrophobic/amphiphilic exporter-1
VITSSLLTLVVVPVIYTFIDDLTAWFKRSRAGKAPSVAGGGAAAVVQQRADDKIGG